MHFLMTRYDLSFRLIFVTLGSAHWQRGCLSVASFWIEKYELHIKRINPLLIFIHMKFEPEKDQNVILAIPITEMNWIVEFSAQQM